VFERFDYIPIQLYPAWALVTLNKKCVSSTLFSILLFGLISAGLSNVAYAVESITVSPASGPPGASVTVTGSGWGANALVAITFDFSFLKEVNANSQGAFTTTVTIPTTATPGAHAIKANAGGAPVEAPFTVTAPQALINLSPTSGTVGAIITISGSNFGASKPITIKFDNANTTTNPATVTSSSTGTFSATITIPSTASLGSHTISATDGTLTASGTFNVVSTATAITLSPTSGTPGTVVTVSGTNFAASKTITIKFDNNVIATNPATVTSSSTGTFSATITIPSTASLGSHTISATDGTKTESAIFNVGATITLSPTSGSVGTTITVAGSGFSANKQITVRFDGDTVTTNPGTVTTSSTGTFSASLAVPSSATAGSHAVQATDGIVTATAIFNVSTALSTTVTLNPTSGATGSSITISGSGFTASSSITIKFDTNTIATTPTSITASASGTFFATIIIPNTAAVGDHTISATDIAGKTASAIFKVIVPATITLSPTAGQRSTTVTVTGSNFNPNSAITIKFDGSTLATTPTPVTTSSTGAFSATITIPNTASAGSHIISATDAAGKSASATFSVSLGPVVILSPTSGITGTEVTVTGSNFTKNTQATIKFGRITVATEPPNLIIGATGALAAKFLVPAGVALGNHIVSVRDDAGRTGNATFTVQSSMLTSISLSPTSVAPGATVTVTGSNFAPNTTVTIKFDGTTIMTVRTTDAGTFSATFAIPSTVATGSHTISATDGAKSASAKIDVTVRTSQTTISLSSTSVIAGSSVTISGSGFAPGSTVTIRLDGNVLATSIATSAGSFSAAVNIPGTVTQGAHTISVSDGTNSSSATLSITEEIREKVTLSKVKLIDQTGSSVSRPTEGMQILIQSDLKNNLASDQQFVYIVQVKDSGGATIMISWMSGTLPAGKQYAVAQSWLVEEKGRYNIEIFTWQSISNPVVLAPSLKTTINVS